ncbi:MAG: sigma 54-interacting transcriptional regulator [Gammaproteobacteria bacterium]|nr:sigma 54-interacting transcriptional regulator [Gammaproteobacteria bacterium]MBT4493567.1 sigma 54-interacting transcriptional regulator [Gammaproteobacteria bacterium]
MTEAKTLGELKASNYQVLPVREEMRRNLMAKLQAEEDVFPNIIGYQETVIPQIENAILSGQDIILLGERGQAKSRIIRSLTCLLDDRTPVLAEVEIPENPYAPVSAQGKKIVREQGDDAAIEWISPDQRYGEKLATPDITIADLIGEVDPIKIAEGRYLSDEEALHFGLIPHTNRGIFAINELPDLAERIQVGLLNVLEERDIQIRGHKIRLDLDVFIVATANPEDYTNRGRIITPLKDRYGSQIRTHYPSGILEEITIMEQEQRKLNLGEYREDVPPFMSQIIAEITQQARKSPDINQRSGVSVRASVANYEAILANALRRAIKTGELDIVPRISDLPFIMPSLQGKVEFEAMEEGREEKIMERLFQDAVKSVYARFTESMDMETLSLQFADGIHVTTGESLPSSEYEDIVKRIDGLEAAIEKLVPGGNVANRASAIEFILEGLHLSQLLNKDRVGGRTTYMG